MKGNEDYDTISTAFAATFQEINGLQQLGFVVVSGKNYKIELIFSSDMKVCGVMLLQLAYSFMFIMWYSSCSQCWALMQLTPYMHVHYALYIVIAGKVYTWVSMVLTDVTAIGGTCQSLNHITA